MADINRYVVFDFRSGCGLLVDLMKKAVQTKNFAELDDAIRTQVEPMLYNKGEGRMIPIAKLVLLRNRDRSRAKWVKKIRLNIIIP